MELIKPKTFAVFTGGCYAGKTTTMSRVKKSLEDNGQKVVILDEIMRRQKIKSIDHVRSSPKDYLAVQEKIVRERIEHEIALSEDNKIEIVLADRSIVDSLFYMTFYMNVNAFNEDELRRYNNLLIDTVNHCNYAHKKIYDRVYFFAPIDGATDDKYRPVNLDILKYTESMLIKVLNNSWVGAHQLRNFSINMTNGLHVANTIATDLFNINNQKQVTE